MTTRRVTWPRVLVLVLLVGGCRPKEEDDPPGGGAPGGGAGGGGGGAGGGIEPPPVGNPSPRMPLPGQKRVFVTSARFGGNLQMAGQAPTGLEGGDNLCRTSATAANLGGTWKAWLSTGMRMGAAATNAIDRITEVGPWYRMDGLKAFNNKANLMLSPLVAIDHDENRRMIPGEGLEVWTGTSVGGKSSGLDCDHWSVGAANRPATAGLPISKDMRWSDGGPVDCGLERRLYCIEQ